MGPARSVWGWLSNSSTSFRLAPEQKARSPAPVTTSTAAESSAVKASIVSARPTAMAAVMLLWASGRFSVATVTGPRRSTSSSSIRHDLPCARRRGGYAVTLRGRVPAGPPGHQPSGGMVGVVKVHQSGRVATAASGTGGPWCRPCFGWSGDGPVVPVVGGTVVVVVVVGCGGRVGGTGGTGSGGTATGGTATGGRSGPVVVDTTVPGAGTGRRSTAGVATAGTGTGVTGRCRAGPVGRCGSTAATSPIVVSAAVSPSSAAEPAPTRPASAAVASPVVPEPSAPPERPVPRAAAPPGCPARPEEWPPAPGRKSGT